ncbi:hypothetical protein CYMTET_13050 [Cymbomonas tetramitiformis]|uniref:EF-hand domain-containing protein n=1 Tax=Cymbomonas tetramitiformis TaxID=36881 RepID=A0AAE0LBK4_9CHLO|nr:hypothetical protein CYMTET_13050 [Cymbomonas tetramitiformis]
MYLPGDDSVSEANKSVVAAFVGCRFAVARKHIRSAPVSGSDAAAAEEGIPAEYREPSKHEKTAIKSIERMLFNAPNHFCQVAGTGWRFDEYDKLYYSGKEASFCCTVCRDAGDSGEYGRGVAKRVQSKAMVSHCTTKSHLNSLKASAFETGQGILERLNRQLPCLHWHYLAHVLACPPVSPTRITKRNVEDVVYVPRELTRSSSGRHLCALDPPEEDRIMSSEGRQRLLMSLNSQKFRLATIALTGSLFLVFFLALWGSDLGDFGDAAPEEEALEIISKSDMEQLSSGMEEMQQQQAPPGGSEEDTTRLSSVQNGMEQTSTRNASDGSSARLSKKEKKDRREAGRPAGLAGATRLGRVEKSAGNKPIDPSSKAEGRKRKKQKRQLGVGWVKAMFDRMDHDRDGIVTLSELSEFAEKWNLPTVYVQDFLRYADRSKNRTVTFQDFVTTIRAREMALNKACQPFENDEDMSVLQEVWARGKWLIGLMVLQSLSGAILQHYERLIQVLPGV